MPYRHHELDKLPFEKLEEETKVCFDLSKLTKDQTAAFHKIHKEVIGKPYGEPFDIARHIFDEF